MISFYPGPSRVYDEIPKYVKEAHQQGILSMNHRSPEFESLCKKTVALLKKKLSIPLNYSIFFMSSATECWETIAQSIITNKSYHVFSGAFGEKWYDYTRRLRPEARSIPFDRESMLQPEAIKFADGDLICITQNETSNGTQVSDTIIAAIQKNNTSHLIAVDATSSMAGIRLNFQTADCWFASVQKCFGLPAGLAVMAVSPKAMERIRALNENLHYNSMVFMAAMMDKWQTPCTPNVLGIYLLFRTLQNRPSIAGIHRQTKKRFDSWHAFFKRSEKLKLLIENDEVRSFTVLPVRVIQGQIERIKSTARNKGFLIGEGYGTLKKDTFRIANFPALKDKEIRGLMGFLSAYL